MEDLIYKDEVYQLVGAAMEVHSQLGCGFLEAVYQEALAIEFQIRKIPFTTEPPLSITYKDIVLEKYYSPDFVAFDKIIIEIKAIDKLTSREDAQILNYLKVGNYKVGLLLNFGSESLDWRRRALSRRSNIQTPIPKES